MSNSRAILGDFGYGMLYDNVPSTTSVGSLHYASPEVILKETTYIGPEIDVWSLGTHTHDTMKHARCTG
jgi:serine/threonine protein kinase